ncbi:MAG: hypothetical protein IT284_00185 [Bacteroidetes bacterium]|nr:hypothetical protein [Bacteroidota bacterium]
MREEELYSSGIFASELDDAENENDKEDERDFDEDLDEDDEDYYDDDEEVDAEMPKYDEWN